MIRRKKVAPRKRVRQRQTTSCPCPACGRPSRVTRTTRGERVARGLKRDFVLRERRCMGTEHHRFKTEERAR